LDRAALQWTTTAEARKVPGDVFIDFAFGVKIERPELAGDHKVYHELRAAELPLLLYYCLHESGYT
jgi:hypothetical protein